MDAQDEKILAMYDKILKDIGDEEEDPPLTTSTYTREIDIEDTDTEAYRSFVKLVEGRPTPVLRPPVVRPPRGPHTCMINLKRKRKRKDKDTSIRACQFSGQFSFDGIKGVDQKILDYLQQPAIFAKEDGVHRDKLVQHLKVPLEKIMESIRSLVEEGAIHSTDDDCHYKSTCFFVGRESIRSLVEKGVIRSTVEHSED